MSPSVADAAELDPLIHAPPRLMIMAILYGVASADFLYLLRETALTKGNLSSHLAKLEAAGYIAIEKSFVGKKAHTACRITPGGTAAFAAYRERLRAVADGLPAWSGLAAGGGVSGSCRRGGDGGGVGAGPSGPGAGVVGSPSRSPSTPVSPSNDQPRMRLPSSRPTRRTTTAPMRQVPASSTVNPADRHASGGSPTVTAVRTGPAAVTAPV